MGELVVTGDGVARGYADPERDRDRFVHVVIDGQKVKAYWTGDYVRYRPTDRQLEFFERMDYQVKVRGHRIELPEVEYALLSHEAVSDAITLLREQQDQEPELISFVTVWTNDHPSELDKLESQLRERLRVKLPSYIVPTMIRVLERMPINANGKVDRQALAKIVQAASPSSPVSARVPPRNDVENALCEEFASVLGTDVGITDSFFDLGGHSLIAARLVSSINIRLGCKIYVYDLLQSPQPFALSEIIHTRSNKEVSSSIPMYLERYRQSSSRLTVVLVHGFWGQASIFSKLVTLLDDDFDILLIHDDFFGESTWPKTIKDWSDFYLNDFEKQIPLGQALVLVGYSFGGLIAFEFGSAAESKHCVMHCRSLHGGRSSDGWAHPRQSRFHVPYREPPAIVAGAVGRVVCVMMTLVAMVLGQGSLGGQGRLLPDNSLSSIEPSTARLAQSPSY
jgi:acyl carrier protein